MKVFRFAVVVILLLICAIPTFSKVIYVSTSGNDASDGLSWATSKKTVQVGINTAVAGDEVWVAKGTYIERVTLKNSVSLYGGFYSNETDRSQRDWRVNVSILDGNQKGVVVSALSGVTSATRIDGFCIRNGIGSSGGGILCSGASPVIANNTITCNFGSGVYYYNSSQPLIVDNVISANSTLYGGGIYCSGSTQISNNTIVGNNASKGGGIYISSGFPSISNNVVAFNSTGVYKSAGVPVLKNNCVYNPCSSNYDGISPGTGDISVDPKLEAIEYGRVHLQPDSPCIDKGDDNVVISGDLDIDGGPRKLGDHVDIGADESDGTAYSYTPIIVRVSPTGDDANDGSDWNKAKRTLQAGVDAASLAGGDVWVAAGTYYEHITLKPYVYLYGGFSGSENNRQDRNWHVNQTVLDGSASGSVVCINLGGQVNRIDGFVICNGGIGIDCQKSSPYIFNNLITKNCSKIRGGGIYCDTSSPEITNNIITGNTAFYTSSGGGTGGAIYCSGYSSPKIINNTITGNTGAELSSIGAAVTIFPTPYTKVINNIVAFNSSGIRGSSGDMIFKNNCVYNPNGKNYDGISPGTGDITVDPKLEAVEFGQFHLNSSSPCIDKGDDTVISSDWKDIDGDLRKLGDHVDIGADESDGTAYPYTPIAVRVSLTGDDSNDGSSWEKAKRTVQSGVDAASLTGGEVWVSAGTYYEHITLRPYVHLYGGFVGVETKKSDRNWRVNRSVLDGSASGSVVVITGGCCISRLDGLTICNGSGTRDGSEVYGGGIRCYFSSPVIVNCIVMNNSASHGGGISCKYSAPMIANTVISGNSAGFSHKMGGGICCESSAASIINCDIIGNSAQTGTGDGGGICIGSTYQQNNRVQNCIIAYNSSGISGSPTCSNNCLYNPGGIDYDWAQGGLNDIVADPKLETVEYGRVHLLLDSPCIDKGDDSVVVSGDLDIDGQARIQGDHVDIGVDESDGATWSYIPTIVRVSPTGDDTNDGSGWDKAKKTVQSGVDAASLTGGEVWVAAGTYKENVTLKPYAYLYGGFSGSETRRDDRNWCENESVIDTGAVSTKCGYNVGCIDGITVRRSVGDGIKCYGCSIAIVNCTVRESSGNGIDLSNSSSLLANNRILCNKASGIHTDTSSPLIIGNSIVGNCAKLGAGIKVDSSYSLSPVIVNNIVAYNASGIYQNASKYVLKNNCVFNPDGTNYSGVTPGTGDISVDPKLEAVEYGQVHLQPGSPCIDNGDDSVISSDWKDIDGDLRKLGDHVDIGADESDGTAYSYTPIVVRVSPTGDDANDGSGWDKAKRTVQAGINAASLSGGEVWVKAGTYKENVTLWPYAYLYGGFSGAETKRSDRDWKTNESIVDAGGVGNVVTARIGHRSGIVDGFTIRNGEKYSGSGVYCAEGVSVDISSNRISGNGNSGIFCEYSVASITNNYIADNNATYGGGIRCNGSAKITNNVITNNSAGSKGSAGWGGGIYTSTGSVVICNNLIINNNSVSGKGGGIFSNGYSSAIIVNNTIVSNNAYRGGGIGFSQANGSTASVKNNIVAFNSSGLYVESGAEFITANSNCVYHPNYSNYDGISQGSTDITVDPQFVDKANGNYHLKLTSPCIDKGTNTALALPATDMDGEARIMGGVVDIGADECTYSSDAKNLKSSIDYSRFDLPATVTAAFPDFFYVEVENRSCGIRVNKASHGLAVGKNARVVGPIRTDSTGERYIAATITDPAGNGDIDPIGLSVSKLGGGSFGLQCGVKDGSGLNNIGLLIRTWGKVTGVGDGFFCVTDGSKLSNGVKVYGIVPVETGVDPVGKFVSVTGVSSCEKLGDDVVSIVRTRNSDDVKVLN